MAIVLHQFREDGEKQSEGSPCYLGDHTFIVRRLGTRESNKCMKELRQAIFGPLHKFEDGDNELLLANWLAEFGVTNWDLTDEYGAEIKYSKSTARELFLDESYFMSLNAELIDFAARYQHFLYDAAEQDIEEIKKP